MPFSSPLPSIDPELDLSNLQSPFLTPSSTSWGRHLVLKISVLAAMLLLIGFALSYFPLLAPLAFLLLSIVYFLTGTADLIRTVENLVSFTINIDTLMTLAAFSSLFIGSPWEGALLLVLFAFSQALETNVLHKAKSAIISLHHLAPTKTSVICADGSIHQRSVHEITVGTTILVRAGETIPLDGTVLRGASSVSLVHLTGESTPLHISKGGEVVAGSHNIEGSLHVQVTKPSSESTLTSILRLITEAQEAKPKLQNWLEHTTQYYASTIISLSFLIMLSFPFLFNMPFLGAGGALYRALSFLIAASPCALIIAIPIAYLSTLSVCAKAGILLKGSSVIDTLASCQNIAVDKTGTLTTGDLTCTTVELFQGKRFSIPKEGLVAVAAALEENTTHPIAYALCRYAAELQLPKVSVDNFRSEAGFGVVGDASWEGENVPVAIGRPSWIIKRLPEAQRDAVLKRCRAIQETGTILTVMLAGEAIVFFHLHDELRPQVKEAMTDLQENEEMKVYMLTGDHASSADFVAKRANITQVHADLLPETKLDYVAKYSEKAGLIMVGDGVNDAPALARASVGISMGKVGSTTTIDLADAILLNDNIALLPWLIRKAHATQKIIKQNLAASIGVIAGASLLALTGTIPLWLAVILHEGTTVLVGANSLRLLSKHKKAPKCKT